MSFDLKLHAYRLLMDEPFLLVSAERLRSGLTKASQRLVFVSALTAHSLK